MPDHNDRPRRRAMVLAISAVVFAVLALAAIAFPTWIEAASGASPDGGSGELEAFLAVPFGLVSLVLGVLAIRSRRRVAATEL